MNIKKEIKKMRQAEAQIFKNLEKARLNEHYQKTKKRIKSLNFIFELPDDLNNAYCTSYDHWIFFEKRCGVFLFNAYRYSVTTAKHQSSCRYYISGCHKNEVDNAYLSIDYGRDCEAITPLLLADLCIKKALDAEITKATSRSKYNDFCESSYNYNIRWARIVCYLNKLNFSEIFERLYHDSNTNLMIRYAEKHEILKTQADAVLSRKEE
jgi:hypothetical protein